MKKLVLVLTILALTAGMFAPAVFADEASETAAPTTTATQTSAENEEVAKEPAITPDSILYPVKRLIESVKLFFTFGADNKCELLVTFANERIREAEIMTEKNQEMLVQKTMDAYVKTIERINEKAEDAADEGEVTPTVTAVLGSLEKVSENAQQIIFRAEGVLTEEQAELLKSRIENQVKRTLAVQSMGVVREIIEEANKEVHAAKAALKDAKKAGVEAEIEAAKLALDNAVKAREEVEITKEEIQEFKELIKDECIERENAADKDEKSYKKNREENAKRQAEHLKEILKKREEKRKEIIEKLKDRAGKAVEKQGENLEKHLQKGFEQIQNILKKFGCEIDSEDELNEIIEDVYEWSKDFNDDDDDEYDVDDDHEDDDDEDRTKVKSNNNKNSKGKKDKNRG